MNKKFTLKNEIEEAKKQHEEYTEYYKNARGIHSTKEILEDILNERIMHKILDYASSVPLEDWTGEDIQSCSENGFTMLEIKYLIGDDELIKSENNQ